MLKMTSIFLATLASGAVIASGAMAQSDAPASTQDTTSPPAADTAGVTINSDADNSAAERSFEHVSCDQTAVEVHLTVAGVKDSVGLMTAELYRNDKANFLQTAGRISKTRFAAKAPVTNFCIEVPEPGQYAVVVYHDENANLRIDKGAFGIPKEPWAISNDPPIRFGPPSVTDSLVTVTEGGTPVSLVLNN